MKGERKLTEEEAIQVELILKEASAFGMKFEVKQFAEEYLEDGFTEDVVEAYQWAFEDWCK